MGRHEYGRETRGLAGVSLSTTVRFPGSAELYEPAQTAVGMFSGKLGYSTPPAPRKGLL